jgi:predicted PurR-regulated permease PerM
VPSLRIRTGEAVSDLLVWVAFVAGIFGAFALAGTSLGEHIGKLVGNLPGIIVLAGAALGLWKLIYDLKDDGVPNQLGTMYVAVIWPTWLLGAEGDLAGWASDGIRVVNTWMYNKGGHLVSDDPKGAGYQSILFIFAAVLISFALYTAHRYFSEKRAARANTATTTAVATPTASTTRVTAGRKKR